MFNQGVAMNKLQAGWFLVCGFLGSILLIGGISSYYDYKYAEGWATTEGTVTKVLVTRDEETSEEARSSNTRETYGVEVSYTYTVNGKTFENIGLSNHGRYCFLTRC